MSSGSGGVYHLTPTKALRAMLNDPTVARDPHKAGAIRTELRYRERQSKEARR
jgi:hypothetical protein